MQEGGGKQFKVNQQPSDVFANSLGCASWSVCRLFGEHSGGRVNRDGGSLSFPIKAGHSQMWSEKEGTSMSVHVLFALFFFFASVEF